MKLFLNCIPKNVDYFGYVSKACFINCFPKSQTLNPKHFSQPGMYSKVKWSKSVLMQKAGLNGILDQLLKLKSWKFGLLHDGSFDFWQVTYILSSVVVVYVLLLHEKCFGFSVFDFAKRYIPLVRCLMNKYLQIDM